MIALEVYWPTMILMLVGGLLWLAGELWGVRRKQKGADTTSEVVWWLQARPWIGKVIKVLIGVFVVSLVFHFWQGTPLLP